MDNTVIERALVAHGGSESQMLRTTVTSNVQCSSATCCFETLGLETNTSRQHSHCEIQFPERGSRLASLREECLEPARLRIQELDREMRIGGAYRFSKSTIYKIVGSLAHFDAEAVSICKVSHGVFFLTSSPAELAADLR